MKVLKRPSNYVVWASQMHNCFNLLSTGMHWQMITSFILWSSLITTDERFKWIEANYQATAMISGGIPASMQHLVHHEQELKYGTRADAATIVENHTTSKRLWDYLGSIHHPQGISATFGTIQEVLCFQFYPSNNISIQIVEFQGLLNQAAETSLRLEDKISSMIMFNTTVYISSSYNQLVSTIVHSTKIKDFISSLIGWSILQDNLLRKATWSHGSANLVSRIEEPTDTKALQTVVIWNAPSNVKCSKCRKTNHTTNCCWLLTKKPQFKPFWNHQPQKRQAYTKKQKANIYKIYHKLKDKKKDKSKTCAYFANCYAWSWVKGKCSLWGQWFRIWMGLSFCRVKGVLLEGLPW